MDLFPLRLNETHIRQIFISFFGKSLALQLLGQILCGIPWGVYQTVTTVYASEVLPINLRGYLTSYVNLCWVSQIIRTGAGVLNAASGDRPIHRFWRLGRRGEPHRPMGVEVCAAIQLSKPF